MGRRPAFLLSLLRDLRGETRFGCSRGLGRRAAVYHVGGCGESIQLGSTTGSSFVHEGAAIWPESFNYRITFIADCGKETDLDACVTTACE